MVAEESEGALVVGAEQLERALQELRRGADELTNALLGAGRIKGKKFKVGLAR